MVAQDIAPGYIVATEYEGLLDDVTQPGKRCYGDDQYTDPTLRPPVIIDQAAWGCSREAIHLPGTATRCRRPSSPFLSDGGLSDAALG